MKTPRSDRLALMVAGSLFLVGLAGCAASRTQTTADNRPQVTSYGGRTYGQVAPQGDPGYGPEEYPDFRGKRTPPGTGNGTGTDGRSVMPGRPYPPAAQSGTELVEPPRFPVEGEPAATDAVDRRSFRETLHQKMAGLWNRRGSSDTPNETTVRPPLATAAPSGWDIRMSDDSVARRKSENSIPEGSAISDTEMFDLDAPVDKRQPPEWGVSRLSNPTSIAVSEPRMVSSGLSQPRLQAGAEPVRMVDPPRLNVPPSGADPSGGAENTPGLAISRMVICRQVRGYDDVVEIHPQQLRCGQPILVYASVDNFFSIATAKGYRTLTTSTLEIQGADGDVVLRMPLGTATDLSDAPRQDFFLTHRVTVPANLPAGDYIFDLRIDDLQAHETSRSQMAVTVTADRTPPDGTGDTSKFATRPDSFQR